MFQLKTYKCYRGKFVENCGICGLNEEVDHRFRLKHSVNAEHEYGKEGLEKLNKLAKLAEKARKEGNIHLLSNIHNNGYLVPWLVNDDTRGMLQVFCDDKKSQLGQKKRTAATKDEQDQKDAAQALLELCSGADASKKSKQTPVEVEAQVAGSPVINFELPDSSELDFLFSDEPAKDEPAKDEPEAEQEDLSDPACRIQAWDDALDDI
jgi:hypothetical protein